MAALLMTRCPYCDQHYPTQAELDDHVLAAHRSDPHPEDER